MAFLKTIPNPFSFKAVTTSLRRFTFVANYIVTRQVKKSCNVLQHFIIIFIFFGGFNERSIFLVPSANFCHLPCNGKKKMTVGLMLSEGPPVAGDSSKYLEVKCSDISPQQGVSFCKAEAYWMLGCKNPNQHFVKQRKHPV